MTIIGLIADILWIFSVALSIIILYKRQRRIEDLVKRSMELTGKILNCNKNLAETNERIINILTVEPKETKNERNKKK
jgi:hypothetical protein